MVEEKGKQAEERQAEARLWRPWRSPRRRMGWRVLWAVGMVVAVLTAALLIVDLRPEIWKDLLEGRVLTLVALGFSLTAIVVMLAIASASRSWSGFQGKTVWDFLQLLIVPLMLVALGFWFTAQQDARQQQIENQRAQQAQKVENRRAEAERELAEQRAQDEALQAYLDQMSGLLLERDLRTSEKRSEVRTLARARTLTVLERLDPGRKTAVMRFLGEAVLIQRGDGRDPIIDLGGADLRDADLRDANLDGANLDGANLSDANLRWAHLSNASLFQADLRDADLSWAFLNEANLNEATLRDANLNNTDLYSAFLPLVDLSAANLNNADLRDALLDGANLRDADLSDANLRDATLRPLVDLSAANLNNANLSGVKGITNEELDQQAASLKGATMPDGQKYEDWLKSRGEDGG